MAATPDATDNTIEALQKLVSHLDIYLSNAGLIVNYSLPPKVIRIIAKWIESYAESEYYPYKGESYICYLVPRREVNKLRRSCRVANTRVMGEEDKHGSSGMH